MKITPSAAAPENYEYHADEAILNQAKQDFV